MFSFERLQFYIKHSYNDLLVNGQRTLFGLFCISSGVAAIVGLLTLGVMVSDTLSGNLQESNRGDLSITPLFLFGDNEESDTNGDGDDFESTFTPAQVGRMTEWFAEQEGVAVEDVCTDATDLCITSQLSYGASLVFFEDGVDFTAIFAVDTEQYPLYGDVETDDGNSLTDLIDVQSYTEGGVIEVVISRNLADKLDMEVGDEFNLFGISNNLVVKGIVPTRTEGGIQNIAAGILGYIYMNDAISGLISDSFAEESDTDTRENVSRVMVRLDDPSQVTEIAEDFQRRFGNIADVYTTEDLRSDNEDVSTLITQFNSIMGLLSLLIGGIGIVNTMLVVVRRRTNEVAILKTIGLEPGEVSTLFFVESVMMGIIGSAIGIPFGFLIAYVTRGAVGAFVAQDLAFRIALEPIGIGLIVGTLVTAIFGLLPILAAGQVRPATVLQPQVTNVPRAGLSRSVFALAFIIVALSGVTQGLLNDLLSGDDIETLRDIARIAIGIMSFIMGAMMVAGGIWYSWTRNFLPLKIFRWGLLLVGLPIAGFVLGSELPSVAIILAVFIISGILYGALWVIIWLVGHLPAFNIADLKIALRSMLSAKGRVASTLLALIIGVFTLSLVFMLVSKVSDAVENLLEDFAGGNIIVFTLDADLSFGEDDNTDEVETPVDALQTRLEEGISGVESYGIVRSYSAELVSYHDVSRDETFTPVEIRRELDRESFITDDDIEEFFTDLGTIDARSVDANLPDVSFPQGRQLNPSDEYSNVIVVPNTFTMDALGVDVGDELSFRFFNENDGTRSETLTFEVVGLSSNTGGVEGFGSLFYVPLDFLPEGESIDVDPDSVAAVVNASDDKVEDVARELRKIDNVLVFETRLINDIINRLLETFTTLPLVISIVVLITGGVVIANSVALAMLERRREIAIMKSVGLQRRRVLGMLMLENGIMGCVGGLIGVGISALMLFAALIVLFQRSLGESIPIQEAFLMMMVCIGITLVAAVISVWGASSEKPLTVLRHE